MLTRMISYTVLLLIAVVLGGIGLLLQSKSIIYQNALPTTIAEEVSPFPVSVNVETREIIESPIFTTFYENTFALENTKVKKWFGKLASVLARRDWYQNMASPVGRIVVIWPGERKEEVIQHIGDILDWDNENRAEFARLIDSQSPTMPEGKYFPGQYLTHRSATPLDIASLISTEFAQEVQLRYPKSVADKVPLSDALIIASLLEREASDFQNQREVAGVIWNRLFIDMPLQLDATLQYAKANTPNEPKWWPVVRPADKFIDSEFNSYQNKGLPPSPIANPSAEAILAALNPIATDCLYYFHGPNGDYYCSKSYPEHVSKLKEVYGQGS